MALASHRCASVLGGATHAWAELMALARSRPNIIDLGQGYPDFEGAAVARVKAADVVLKEPKLNQYSQIGGLPILNQAISQLYRHKYGATLDPATEVVSTCGGTESLYCLFQALIDPGDKVLIFEPFFPWYLPDVKLAGGDPLVVPLREPDFTLDGDAVRAAFAQRPKLVVVNTPHNPTGRVLTKEDLQLIADLCVKHDVIAVSDEAYETITFPGYPHLRLADFPGMRERTVTMGTASKLLSLTGWRVGWLTGPKDLIAPIRTIHSYVSFCPPTPLQVGVTNAILALIDDPAAQRESEDVALLLADNAKTLAEALNAMQGVNVFPPQGGYFLVANIAQTGMADIAFCRWLIEEKNINATPMSIFYSPRPAGQPCTSVRFAICKRRETIEQAVAALRR
eukprot:EG_transcript_11207